MHLHKEQFLENLVLRLGASYKNAETSILYFKRKVWAWSLKERKVDTSRVSKEREFYRHSAATEKAVCLAVTCFTPEGGWGHREQGLWGGFSWYLVQYRRKQSSKMEEYRIINVCLGSQILLCKEIIVQPPPKPLKTKPMICRVYRLHSRFVLLSPSQRLPVFTVLAWWGILGYREEFGYMSGVLTT